MICTYINDLSENMLRVDPSGPEVRIEKWI
jgi:hypothetical protein